MRGFLALLTLALLTPLAAAQSGPAPGYSDPASYAADYAQEQAGEASADPAGYAQSKASQEGAEKEANHSAWLACWSADWAAHTDVAGACRAYYTPPGAAAPEQPEEPAEPEEGTVVENVTGDVQDVLAEVKDAAEGGISDPGSLPHQVQRIAQAVVRFVERVVDEVGRFLVATVEFVREVLGLGLHTTTSLALGPWDAAVATGAMIVDAAEAAAHAVGDAGRLVAKGVGDATQSVGHAVDALVETIRGLLGKDPAPPVPARPEPTGDPLPTDAAGDVLDRVRGLLP